ncbi:MAG: vitamin K epoxide reductase family protein [Solirubrobacterales bacterium]
MSDRRLGAAVGVLSLAGIGISGYLTYVHYADLDVLCLVGGGCETVQNSRYAKFAGVPVPVLGLAGYVSILLSLLIPGDAGRATAALFALTGFGFSVYLTWLELVRIKAICQWCIGSATVMTLLAIVSVARLWRYRPPAAAPRRLKN